MRIYLLVMLLLAAKITCAQQITGLVLEKDRAGKFMPLPAANVYWINTTIGTVTDAAGVFSLQSDGVNDLRLIISYTGYRSDTVKLEPGKTLRIVLESSLQLNEVQVVQELSHTGDPLKMEQISSIDLKKAACCNLGESFESNATVDVTYKDAVSGSKEIQVLGLSGAYTQLLTENAPLLQGIGLTYGLNSIPGTLIDAINIVKGPGSVILGHQSISGLVNVDLKDPLRTNRLFVNLFQDQNQRSEANIDIAHPFSPHLGALLALHADRSPMHMDQNSDSFLDMPLTKNFSLLNKWKYINKGWISQNSFRYMHEDRAAGSRHAHDELADSTHYYQKLGTDRLEFYGRTGYVIPTQKYNSIGFQYGLVSHVQRGFYGFMNYHGEQRVADLRLIYDREWSPSNTMNVGISFRHLLSDEIFGSLPIHKEENVPGVFVENTFKADKRFALITGMRADNFQNKIYFTPRANAKWSIDPTLDLRLSAGTGWRTADILAENPSLLASRRTIIMKSALRPEKAFNLGTSITKRFVLDYRKGNFSVDFYRTVFTDKVIPDFERDSTSRFVVFDNLQDKAFSDNFQVEIEYELIKNLRVKTAYKFLNVYQLLNGKSQQLCFVAKHRLLMNAYYESFNRKWTFNATLQGYGRKRLPSTANNPSGMRMADYSPAYTTVNAQINRIFKKLEIYLGCENIFDYRQYKALIDPENPYGNYFDTSFIWGPLEGRKIYLGLRFKLK